MGVGGGGGEIRERNRRTYASIQVHIHTRVYFSVPELIPVGQTFRTEIFIRYPG